MKKRNANEFSPKTRENNLMSSHGRVNSKFRTTGRRPQLGTADSQHQHSEYAHVGTDVVDLAVFTSNAMAALWTHFPFVFRIGEHGSGAGLLILREVCLERGWNEYEVDGEGDGSKTNNFSGNFWWTLSNFGPNTLQSFSTWQVVNRMTKNFSYTSKDTCTRYFRRLRTTYGDIFDLCPLTFNVPSEYAKLCVEHTKRKSRAFWTFWDRAHYIGTPVYKPVDREAQPVWICKPVGKSQGKGICVFDTVTSLSYNRRSVVQEYITRPLLIGPYKWDLRIYVVIVSLNPLVFYAYREGLVRFATLPFDLNNLTNPYAHLTNSSVNKQSPAYYQNKTGIGRGCKWSLSKLRHYFNEKGLRDWHLWQRIGSILVLTIVGEGPTIVTKFNAVTRAKMFFLMGFDILVDRSLTPFLIEVNSNPSLSNDCEVDRIVKKRMLHDLFDLLNLPDRRNFENYVDANATEHNQNQSPTPPIISSKDSSNESLENESMAETCLMSGTETYPGQSSSTNNKVDADSQKNYAKMSPIVHTGGPIWLYNQIQKLTRDVSLKFLTTTILKSKATTPLQFPIMVSLPLNRGSQVKSRSTPFPPGLMLRPPNWNLNPSVEQGNWVRIFPFHEPTEKMILAGTQFDVKDSVRQVQELLKFANQIDLGEVDDTQLDKLVKDKLKLTTIPWHPPFTTGKAPRF